MKRGQELERFCKYCENAEELHNENAMLCRTNGVVSSGYCCRKFRYDPLKRTPSVMRKENNNLLLPLEFVDI